MVVDIIICDDVQQVLVIVCVVQLIVGGWDWEGVFLFFGEQGW